MLLPFIRQVYADEMRLSGVLQDMTGLKSGLVRLGTVTAVANEWLPSVLKRFMAFAPGIEYEVLIGNGDIISQWLKEDRIDIGLFTPKVGDNLNARLLHLDELRVIFPKGHPLSQYSKIPLKALVDYPYILHGASWCKQLEEGLEQNKQKIPIRYTTVGATSIVNLVREGIGVSILPELLLENDKHKVQSRPLDPSVFRKIFLVTHGEPTMPAVKRWAVESAMRAPLVVKRIKLKAPTSRSASARYMSCESSIPLTGRAAQRSWKSKRFGSHFMV